MDFNGIIIKLISNNDAKHFLKERLEFLDVMDNIDSTQQEFERAAEQYRAVVIRLAGSLLARLCEMRIKANG